MDQNAKENLLISSKFSNPTSFALFSTFLVPQSKRYANLIDIEKIANGEHLEQHKFKSNEKDRARTLFYPFFGILWAYLLMKC